MQIMIQWNTSTKNKCISVAVIIGLFIIVVINVVVIYDYIYSS